MKESLAKILSSFVEQTNRTRIANIYQAVIDSRAYIKRTFSHRNLGGSEGANGTQMLFYGEYFD